MTEAVAPFANESQESLLAMRIWTLLQTATSLGVEALTVEELVRASGLHAKLNRREREALDIVLDAQRANTAGTFIPVHPNPLRANARQYYDIKDKSAVILYLQCLVSNYLGRTLYGDNGVDPILGAPHPPINYQLFIHNTQPRLTWTVPDVNLIIQGFQGDSGGPTYNTEIIPINYPNPPWNVGETYIENEVVFRNDIMYRSLQDDNTGHDPASSPLWWVVDPTIFALYELRTMRGETTFSQRVRSDNTPQTIDGAEYSYVIEDGGFFFRTDLDFDNLLDSKRAYYITATFNSVTTSSNTVYLGGE